MKQTAVEWLYNNLKSHFEHDGDLLEVVQFSFEQAKEMEKQQKGYSEEDIALAFNEGQAYSVRGKLVDGKEWLKAHKKEWFKQFKNK